MTQNQKSESTNTKQAEPNSLRTDLRRIQEWIEPGSHLLDLACGDGTLLSLLQETKSTSGYGMEISQPDIESCLARGLNVIHRDVELGLEIFDAQSFDYVLTTHSIQTLRFPARTLLEMVRVGVKGIVSFPNMGYWSARLSIGVLGKMPRTFENLCTELNIEILRREAVSNTRDRSFGSKVLPNLFSETALYEITAKKTADNSN